MGSVRKDRKRKYTLIGIEDLEHAADYIEAIDDMADPRHDWPLKLGFKRRGIAAMGEIIAVWNNGPQDWYAMTDPDDEYTEDQLHRQLEFELL